MARRVELSHRLLWEGVMEDKLIIVSSDSHAGVPKELWTHYLDERYHELLP